MTAGPSPLLRETLDLRGMLVAALAVLVAGCTTQPKTTTGQHAGSRLTRAESELRNDDHLGGVLGKPRIHRPALLISVIDETTSPPFVVDQEIGDHESYFYPASTIKLFAAVGALLRIQELQASGVAIDADSPLVFHPMFEGESREDEDTTNLEGGSITIRHEIRKLFIVSDNRAFNRLLGFVGRADLNDMMHAAGLDSVRINHRLSLGYSREQNRHMPRIDVLRAEDTPYTIPSRVDPPTGATAGVPGFLVGTAQMVAGERREGPKDFSYSNRVSHRDLQDALIMVVRPDVDLGKTGFALTSEHRALLLDAMGTLPRESANPVYDPSRYPDDWAKFLLPGVRRIFDADRVRIFNKIGLAYGFTSTTAALSLDHSPPTVFVTGSIYTNANNTLNDNVYEYDGVAFPFWERVGEIIATELLSQPRESVSP